MSLNLSDEERLRRSEQAKRMVAEGKIGGPRPGSGRPRKQRVGELIAEEIAERADEIKSALFRTIDEKAPLHLQLAGASKLLDIEREEEKLRLEEEAQLERLKRDELLERVTAQLERLGGAGIIELPEDLWEEVPHDDDRAALGPGEDLVGSRAPA
jgi:hypothetical protein